MPDDAERREAITRVEAHIEHFSGPIPPPGAMQGYEDVSPGSADRILTMAEYGQRHRARYEILGLIFGFVVAMSLIALAAYLVTLGFAWQSVGVVVGSIATAAGTFVYSNHKRHQALSERREAMRELPPQLKPPLEDSASRPDQLEG